MIAMPLYVIKLNAGKDYVFGSVAHSTNEDAFFAEVHEQRDGKDRLIEKSGALPTHEVAIKWMRNRCEVAAA